MDVPQIVIDTNVLVSALRSRQGASNRLLRLIGSDKYRASVSVPLVLEYEEVCRRSINELQITEGDLEALLDYVCRVANRITVSYLWRPFLKDPKDDMILELAVAAGCSAIVTYNQGDFRGVEEQFAIQVLTPREFLQNIGELP